MIKNHRSSICHRFVHTLPPPSPSLRYPSAGYYFFSAGRTRPSSPPPPRPSAAPRSQRLNKWPVVGTARVAGEKRVFHERPDRVDRRLQGVRHPTTDGRRSARDSLGLVGKTLYVFAYRRFTRAQTTLDDPIFVGPPRLSRRFAESRTGHCFPSQFSTPSRLTLRLANRVVVINFQWIGSEFFKRDEQKEMFIILLYYTSVKNLIRKNSFFSEK